MDRIQIALAEILIKRDMLIPYTYRDIARKYNVCEATFKLLCKEIWRSVTKVESVFSRNELSY